VQISFIDKKQQEVVKETYKQVHV